LEVEKTSWRKRGGGKKKKEGGRTGLKEGALTTSNLSAQMIRTLRKCKKTFSIKGRGLGGPQKKEGEEANIKKGS